MPRGLKLHLPVLAAYAALVFCVLGPMDPGRQIWGGDTNDVVNYLGNLIWQAREAAGGAPVSRHTTMLLFPDGGAVWPPDLLGGVLILPVVWLAGPLWAYNMLVLADLVFACWAMFILARRLSGGDTWAALLCGAVYGLAPVTLGHVNNGIVEQLAAGWLPLFVAALFRLADDAAAPAGRRATALAVLAAAAAWWAASVSSHWYHGAYAGLLFGLLLLALGGAAWRRSGRAPVGLVTRGAATLALFTVLVLPVVAWFVTPYESDASLMRALEGTPTLASAPEVNGDVAYLFAPRPPMAAGEESFLHLAYLGFSVPLLALAGLVRAGRRRAVAGWLALALLWAVLAMGPRLVVGGQLVGAGGGHVTLPFAWLAWLVPPFARMDFPYRCVLVAHLALAAAVAAGIGGIWRDRPWRRLVVAAAATAVLLETALWSGAVVPVPHTTLAPRGPMDLLATEDGTAVLDLPLRLRPDDSRRFAVNQLFHRRPIPYTSFITARTPFSPSLARESLIIGLLHAASQRLGERFGDAPMHWRVFHGQMGHGGLAARALACAPTRRCPAPLQQALDKDLAALTRRGFGHVALHTDLLPSGSKLPGLCATLFGPPTGKADRVWVYQLRSAAK